MRGADIKAWRARNGYTQDELMRELDVKSRQTISSWENSEKKVPRIVQIALIALEQVPDCRQRAGKTVTPKERRAFLKRSSE